MPKKTVLICDDNEAVHGSLRSYLEADGFEVLSAYDGETALDELRRGGVDLVVLDIMLPGIDGLEVYRRARARAPELPILMLSAKGEERDRVHGLETGADDYVVKPFSPREVALRVRQRLHRAPSSPGEARELRLAELTVLPDRYKAFIRGREAELTSKETEVLSFLIAHAGETMTREQLLNVAWGYEYYGDTRVVDTLIKRLRQKIAAPGVHYVIRSVYGVGYLIEEMP